MDFPLALPCSAASLFHDPNGAAFADLAIDGHRETWPIRSRQFRHWLRRRYYEETRSAASSKTVRSAVDLLEARAQIGPDGRKVVASPPVRFRRAAGMLPLPIPQRGGSIEALAAFLNLPAPDEFVLMVAWLLAPCSRAAPIHCW
jgi:hypothetical protein